MKQFALFGALLIALCVVSCRTTAQAGDSEPGWMSDAGRLALFPSERYISAFAFGSDAASAQTKAAALLSEYMQSHVSSSVTYTMENASATVTQNAEIQTDALLFNTEYTVPYYSPLHGMYGIVAFIDREKAFVSVEPALRAVQAAFPAEYAAALAKDDTLDKIRAISRARTVLDDFSAVYTFARAVHPQKSAAYEPVAELVQESARRLVALKAEVPFRVEVENDVDGRIRAAVADALSMAGYSVTNAGSPYAVRVTVQLPPVRKTAQTYGIEPAATLELVSGGTVRQSVLHQVGTVAGFDAATAERRALAALETELWQIIVQELL